MDGWSYYFSADLCVPDVIVCTFLFPHRLSKYYPPAAIPVTAEYLLCCGVDPKADTRGAKINLTNSEPLLRQMKHMKINDNINTARSNKT